MMNLNKNNLEIFDLAVQAVVPNFLQKSVFEGFMDAGLKVAHTVIDTSKIKQKIEQDNKNTIRLTFPNLDFGGNDLEFLTKYWDEDIFHHPVSPKIG